MSEEKKTAEPTEATPAEEPKVEAQVEAKTEAPVTEEKPAETTVAAPAEVSAAPAEAPAVAPEVPAAPVEEPRIEGAVNKGDFILIEMTGKALETGEVFDTTSEEVAREKGIHREGTTYGPRLVVVGDGWVLRGLDTRLRGVKPEEQTSIEVPPAEAFGERDPNNVQLIPYRVLRSKGVNPVPGAESRLTAARPLYVPLALGGSRSTTTTHSRGAG